jgi:hypothetical protein
MLIAAAACPALAVDAHWRLYPEFRHVSALPGNGFGVDAQGQVGFGGALNMNLPCAYTPSRGNYAGGYHSSSVNHGVELGFGGNDVDGTAFFGIGLSDPGSGIYVSEVFTERNPAVNTFNLQCQIQAETPSFPAVAVGCLDLQDRRPGVQGGMHGARSIYIVATEQLIKGDQPLFLTLGFGGGRFNHNPSGAVSWYPGRDLNLGFEYDGMIPTPHATVQFYHRGKWGAAANLSWANFERPDVGVTVTRRR